MNCPKHVIENFKLFDLAILWLNIQQQLLLLSITLCRPIIMRREAAVKVNYVGRQQSQGLCNSSRKIQTNTCTMGHGVSLHEVMQSRVACIPCMQLSLHDSVLSDKAESRPIPAPEQNH